MTPMADEKQLLKLVFGDSSDSEIEDSLYDDDVCHQDSDQSSPSWEPNDVINGLWLCRNFLSPQQQTTLLSAVQNEGWFADGSNNQAMRFGELPSWAVELSCTIGGAVLSGAHICEPTHSMCSEKELPSLFPSELFSREPLFDQLIVNVYQPGEGICAHVDLMRFEDGIAIVSLESPCVMHFTPAAEDQPLKVIPVHLTPGSLVLLSGEARYLWMHEINRKPGFQVWEGRELSQQRRTSITLRKLCCSE
ncbi:hypothetical protein Tsubulata_030687 [Turnera subulata]|uniref:Fe2OG dioxygenase domain-containing protein n=1 Tax=Turnera subulata TaxID=218843 RepID=A0A9Q0GC07_9ROSI|nr:hypothetical protein Tsubulata_030687 [Turnera subulata]